MDSIRVDTTGSTNRRRPNGVTLAPPSVRTRVAIVGFAFALGFASSNPDAHAFDWPPPETRAVRDPIESLRWTHTPAWIHSSPGRVRDVLATLTADDPRTLAYRAVALRALNREDGARATLARAIQSSPEVLDDPDVALTQAYLQARQRHYASAVDLARRALAMLPGASPREMLVVEVSRWSMARGPDGLATAMDLLRGWLTFGDVGTALPAPLVRATLALALARSPLPADRLEAVEIARSLGPDVRPDAWDIDAILVGTTVVGEGRAAAGECLLLAGDPTAAVAPLEASVPMVPAPWRVFETAALADARRLSHAHPSPTNATPALSPRPPR